MLRVASSLCRLLVFRLHVCARRTHDFDRYKILTKSPTRCWSSSSKKTIFLFFRKRLFTAVIFKGSVSSRERSCRVRLPARHMRCVPLRAPWMPECLNSCGQSPALLPRCACAMRSRLSFAQCHAACSVHSPTLQSNVSALLP